MNIFIPFHISLVFKIYFTYLEVYIITGMPSGLPLVHLHPISVVEPGGTSKVPVSGSDRLSPAREGKLQWRVLSTPHLEQGKMLPVEKSHGCGCCFFSLTDGS